MRVDWGSTYRFDAFQLTRRCYVKALELRIELRYGEMNTYFSSCKDYFICMYVDCIRCMCIHFKITNNIHLLSILKESQLIEREKCSPVRDTSSIYLRSGLMGCAPVLTPFALYTSVYYIKQYVNVNSFSYVLYVFICFISAPYSTPCTIFGTETYMRILITR